MKEKIKSLTGKAMLKMTKEILERTGALSNRLQGSALEKLKLSDLSDVEVISLPEASAIALTDWYYCNKINRLGEKENLKKIIMIRKIFQEIGGKKEEIKKLNQVLEKQPQSLVEFIKEIVEIEHKVCLSSQNIEHLILEYKKIRKVE